MEEKKQKILLYVSLLIRLAWLLPASLFALFYVFLFAQYVFIAVKYGRFAMFLSFGMVVNTAVGGVFLWLCFLAWRKTRTLFKGEMRVSAGKVFLQGLSVLVGFAVAGMIVVPKFTDLMRYSCEGKNNGNLAVLRISLDSYKDANGKYPEDLHALISGGGELKQIPFIWDVWGARSPHPRTAEIVYYDGRKTGDSGKWAYVNNPKDSGWGNVYIDCTHTDSRGTAWSGH